MRYQRWLQCWRKLLPAVVSISVEGTQTIRQRVPDLFRYFYGPNSPREQVQEQPFTGLGSGVIIDSKEGYIVTNAHVVNNADEITVLLSDGRELEAKKIGEDKDTDIALLKVEAKKDLTDIELADSDELRVGDFVVAIGNPFGIGQTVTSGIVSAFVAPQHWGSMLLKNYIQTDAAINRGNSGGALVNLKGELVGINTAIVAPTGGNVGIGFAIPSNMMKNLVTQLVQFGEVRRGLLGITGGNVDSGLAEAMELKVNKGAYVSQVTPESAADKGGLKAGDVITSLNGRDIKSFAELRAKVATLGAGAEVKIGVIRDSNEINVVVTLDDSSESNIAAEDIHSSFQGATFADGETNDGKSGVEVTAVEARSWANRLGLEQGDIIIGINRTRINSVNELRRYLGDFDRGVIALNVRRGDSSLYLVSR